MNKHRLQFSDLEWAIIARALESYKESFSKVDQRLRVDSPRALLASANVTMIGNIIDRIASAILVGSEEEEPAPLKRSKS